MIGKDWTRHIGNSITEYYRIYLKHGNGFSRITLNLGVRGNAILAGSLCLILIAIFLFVHPESPSTGLNQAVLDEAYAFSDGGGYDTGCEGTGVPEKITWRGIVLLEKANNGSYCCGFTFAVFMRIAAQHGLLDGLYLDDIWQFHREWYGADGQGGDRLMVEAIVSRGIGIYVPVDELEPGDFVQYWTVQGAGHSCIFLNYIESNGQRIGIKYRSSQIHTEGIGDAIAYFSLRNSQNGASGEIDPNRTYGARLLLK